MSQWLTRCTKHTKIISGFFFVIFVNFVSHKSPAQWLQYPR